MDGSARRSVTCVCVVLGWRGLEPPSRFSFIVSHLDLSFLLEAGRLDGLWVVEGVMSEAGLRMRISSWLGNVMPIPSHVHVCGSIPTSTSTSHLGHPFTTFIDGCFILE